MTALKASALCVASPQGRQLFRDLHLSIEREHVAMIGRNGVGKSTLLEVLAGGNGLRSGYVTHRGRVELVRQNLRDAEVSRALDEVVTGRERGTLSDAEVRALGLVDLGCCGEVSRLSHGERRKLCLLAAKLRRPQVLLLDEATGGLDEPGLRWLESFIAGLDGRIDPGDPPARNVAALPPLFFRH